MTREINMTMLIALGFMLPAISQAGVLDEEDLDALSGSVTRPCSDFLDAQGTNSMFFPPVPDYVGWTDGPFTTFALIDYAGLASEWLEGEGVKLGATTRCTVLERELANGKAQITVDLQTEQALGFAQEIQAISQYGFLDAPTIFGAKAQDVAAGAVRPALGPATLKVSFVIENAGAPLPDLVEVLVNDPCTYAPVELAFQSETRGTFNGRPAWLEVSQAASSVCERKKPRGLAFTQEVIEIVTRR